ncbi:uncharacterized protein LOC133903050 [Phragmites australis]|uniref:uncharacterized protein LOC133903050 n=1 Tax=Phragmites australis TaxID=29695 RepID=UPI002D7775DB|nr:uncharacterized protein LOC133903050 [Phragmites australis]
MVGKELVVQRNGPVDIREISAKATLREVRQSGHTYVELRRVGKRVIFFCTICLTECFSDNVLFDHLKGNLHSRRYAEAKVTLFGPMPWPFNDGVLFFNNSREKDPLLLDSSSQNARELSLVPQPELARNDAEVTSRLRDGSSSRNGVKGAGASAKGRANGRIAAVSEDNVLSRSSGTDGPLVIPGVLLKDTVLNLPVHLLGYGNIAYRICEVSQSCKKISKIWCAWVGQEGSVGWNTYEQSGFAIVNFSYTSDLGRKWSCDDQDLPISAGSFFVIDDAGHRGKRRKKSFSDQEASSEESNGQSSSPHGNSQAIVASSPTGTSNNLQVDLLSSKSMRRELRKQKRIAAEKVCDICGRPMLPGKDVATLLNCNTGNLACSSRNLSGAYHLFHTSCLLHWTILCQYEMLTDQIASKGKSNRGRKAKNAPKKSKITTILCPECQGTGIHVEGDELEKPTVSLSEMFRFKLKAIEAQKAWLKSPEVLENCSTGLHFPAEHVENSEVALEAHTLEAAVAGARAAAVHFWAGWCEASKQMDEVFAHLAVDFPHAAFLRVEAEEQPEISEAYGVTAVPYFVFCKEGKTVDTLEGANPASLANKVAKIAGLASVAESAVPASLGVAAGPAVLEKVQKTAQQNGSSAAESTHSGSMEDALNKQLERLVNSHPVFLFMKGTPEQPRCGFSRKVVDILKQEGVEFGSFDILTDNDVREGMKKFSNWPTFPQLYCKGELLGGCDIVVAMHDSGELKDVFEEHNIPLQPQGSKHEEAVKTESATEKGGAVSEPIGLTDAQKARLLSLINSNPVMVFIKGSPEEPKCGFSGKLVHILKQENIPFSSFDVLSDDEVRQGLKVFSNWPSYPQLYIKGELVGGSDIVMEMHKSGELKKALSEKGVIPKETLEDRLKVLISSAPVMLFMKGTPDAPRCGFSSKVVNALKKEGISFGSFDILSDEEVRQGLKTYSNWPTFPQLYYKSELIGGCDIILEMEKSGELKSTLSE